MCVCVYGILLCVEGWVAVLLCVSECKGLCLCNRR